MKKLIALIPLSLIIFCVEAQIKRKQTYNRPSDKKNTFLHKQWWIGIKGGGNLSCVDVDKTYSIITPTNYAASDIKKKYESFSDLGAQVSLEATFYYRGFCISVQPGYQRVAFNYENKFTWTDPEQSLLTVDLTYRQNHWMEYLTLPVVVRYEYPAGRFSPYVHAGFYSNILLNANKELIVTGRDQSAGGPNDFESEPVVVGATDLFARYHYGVLGGIGTFYTLGNVRLNLEVQYRMGLSLLNSPENRYDNDRMSGMGDAMDDLRLNNLSVSIGTLFPLRFLSSGFKSSDNLK